MSSDYFFYDTNWNVTCFYIQKLIPGLFWLFYFSIFRKIE